MVGQSVAIKAEVVSADERESDLRRILNFGHTLGHALEAETGYARLLHGEAVAYGMRAATHLAHRAGYLAGADRDEILRAITMYGPIPSLEGISAANLVARLARDKKTVHGRIHFVLPVRIGEVKIVSGLDEALVLEAAQTALDEVAAA
jgi:3-dehydroquinate synthase